MKKIYSIISIILAALLLLSALSSCGAADNLQNEETTEAAESQSDTAKPSVNTENNTDDGTKNTDSANTDIINTEATDTEATDTEATDTEATDTEAADTETTERETASPVIENANALANGVNAYFEQGTNRNNFIIENQNMLLNYAVSPFSSQTVSYIKNPSGNIYIEDTFDVFVTMEGGKTFYASKTEKPTTSNLYRFGYYMYEVRFEEQNFNNGIDINDSFTLDINPEATKEVTARYSKTDNILNIRIEAPTVEGSADPYIEFKKKSYSADSYKFIAVTIKSDAKTTRSGAIYFQAEGSTKFSSNCAPFYMTPDGEYHTYLIPLSSKSDYTGSISNLRLDIDGKKGEMFYLKEIKIIDGDDGNPPNLSLNRSFFTYSDKMHHVAQVVAHSEVNGIAEIGMITRIKADTVAAIVVKDKATAFHYSIDDVDWDSAEYVGFDIKNAGIFGYIIPKDNTSGKLKVTLEDGYYVIIQSRTPEGGTIIPSVESTRNANDFYMGQRIYTDSTHDFSAFLHEAYCERNPLEIKRFNINEDQSIGDAAFVGYDALRGAYKFTLMGARGFLTPQIQSPNKHYNVSFMVKGDDRDRKLYIYTSTTSGNLECAVILDGNKMLLPIPVEVGKNFDEGATGEGNIYNLDDAPYGEAIFPIILAKDERASYTVVHLYQNWGNFPLKQISWIQYHAPYYHLSTGTTETNCIMPYYSTKAGKASLQMLPDHRAWSAPLWEGDPQHTSGGSHTMLSYTNADGKYYSSDNTINVIGAYGPTYADVTMYHYSDDGKIKYSINHMEMPQTDENRGYYEFKYEVLEDLTIKNFKNDFSFYSVTDNNGTGRYTKFGYLNKSGECTVTGVNVTQNPVYYVLGNDCPYFDYFDMVDYPADDPQGYVNVSFLIYNSEIIINGEKSNVPFVVKEFEQRAYLSLDLTEVTLHKGDTITINAIIMPWGSQESEYPESAPDYNVRDVRENTLRNPVKATPVENCETIQSVYIPKIRSTDGKSATFTLSGGHNNIAVRVYGFDKLTAPKLYEKIGEDWVEIILSSSASPDKMGNYQYYDGYNVYYEGNGEYSYSFVVTMDNGAPRTFKLDASTDFKKWPTITSGSPDLLDFFLDPIEISQVIRYPEQFSSISMEYEEFDFIRFGGNANHKELNESYFYAYENGTTSTGGILAFKYRLPKENPDKISDIEFFISTVNDEAKDYSDFYKAADALIADGEWHVLIIDIASFGKPTFADNGSGKYDVMYIRVDPFNSNVSIDTKFDIAYIGFTNSYEEIYKLCSDMEFVTVCKNSSTNVFNVDPKTGEAIGGSGSEAPPESNGEINLLLTPDKIDSAIEDRYQFAKIEIGKDGNVDFISFYGNSHNASLTESYLMAYKGGTVVSGSYLVMKYRLPTTNTKIVEGFEFYTSTVNSSATGSDSYWVTSGIINDGNWHVIVIDLASFNKSTFASDGNGNYIAKYLRFDPFNGVFSKDDRIDVAYIGLSDSLQDIIELNKDLETITLCKTNYSNVIIYNTATGKPAGNVIDPPTSVKLFFSGESLVNKAKSDRARDISASLSDDRTYVTLTPKNGAAESYILFYDNTSASQALGQYMFIKYRTEVSGDRFEVYAGTNSYYPADSSKVTLNTSEKGYVNDGEWHLLIVDLSILAGYNENATDGKYYPMHLRFDITNIVHSNDGASVDVGYFGVGSDLSDILSIEDELGTAYIYNAEGLSTITIS